ncbi:hypothetical protein BDQ17DRAFT_1336191 [Cyathus striatus]|nr:hypothetical protein BDQ17DRAFT_1336191 [Cyathus striatus]
MAILETLKASYFVQLSSIGHQVGKSMPRYDRIDAALMEWKDGIKSMKSFDRNLFASTYTYQYYMESCVRATLKAFHAIMYELYQHVSNQPVAVTRKGGKSLNPVMDLSKYAQIFPHVPGRVLGLAQRELLIVLHKLEAAPLVILGGSYFKVKVGTSSR